MVACLLLVTLCVPAMATVEVPGQTESMKIYPVILSVSDCGRGYTLEIDYSALPAAEKDKQPNRCGSPRRIRGMTTYFLWTAQMQSAS